MTYLELVQRTIRESGAHLEVPDTLSGLDGLQSLFKDWVNQAWEETQIERPDWFFRQDDTSVTLDPTTLTNEVIVPPDEILATFEQDWRLLSLREVYIHDPADTDVIPDRLFYVSWTSWPDMFARSESRQEYNVNDTTEGKPRWYTVAPNGDMYVYPRPDQTYEIQFFAPKAIQTLEVDADEPILDEHYQLGIVYRALMEYALYHDDRSVFERARNKWRSYKKGMEYKYMPDMTFVTDALYRNV